MTDNMFDKFVRDKLADHQSTVPPGLWEKIERNKDKDPRGGFFLPKAMLWVGVFIIATGIGIGYHVSTNNDGTGSTSQVTAPAAANNSGNSTYSNAGNEDGDSRNAAATNDKVTGDDNRSIAGDATNDKEHKNDPAADNRTITQNNGIATDLTPGNDLSASESKRSTKNVSPVNYGGSARGRQARLGQKKKNVFTTPGLSEQPIGNTPATEDSYVHISLTTGRTAYNLRSLAGLDANKHYNLSDLKIVGIDCPPNGRMRRNDWYLEVYASPDIVMKSVKASGNTSFVAKKDSTESQQLSFTGGFRISKSIGENLLIKTGLQYSQINERFDLRTENERRIITVVTIRTVTGSNGADSTVSDTSTVEQVGYRLQRTYNRYRSIDIPLLLSYEFGNENLKFAVNAGAIFNLYSWYTGNTINDSLAVISMSSKGPGIYKHNIGVGLYGGFSIIKPVSNKFDVFLEPYFRYNLSNMTRSGGYSQRFNAAGLNFGIRYKLKGQRTGSN